MAACAACTTRNPYLAHLPLHVRCSWRRCAPLPPLSLILSSRCCIHPHRKLFSWSPVQRLLVRLIFTIAVLIFIGAAIIDAVELRNFFLAVYFGAHGQRVVALCGYSCSAIGVSGLLLLL